MRSMSSLANVHIAGGTKTTCRNCSVCINVIQDYLELDFCELTNHNYVNVTRLDAQSFVSIHKSLYTCG